MGLMLILKQGFLICLFISASFLSTSSSAGIRSASFSNVKNRVGATSHDQKKMQEKVGVHKRVLKVKTNDYGRYDPAPTFVKPPFKLIPN